LQVQDEKIKIRFVNRNHITGINKERAREIIKYEVAKEGSNRFCGSTQISLKF